MQQLVSFEQPCRMGRGMERGLRLPPGPVMTLQSALVFVFWALEPPGGEKQHMVIDSLGKTQQEPAGDFRKDHGESFVETNGKT